MMMPPHGIGMTPQQLQQLLQQQLLTPQHLQQMMQQQQQSLVLQHQVRQTALLPSLPIIMVICVLPFIMVICVLPFIRVICVLPFIRVICVSTVCYLPIIR